MCHLAPDPQSTMEAARQQCWGARSDRANRKQAAFCIPGQAAQHNTDTGRDTETDHLWPKTIHLPCSPRRAELRWIGFLCFPPFLSFVGSGSFFGGEERENQERLQSWFGVYCTCDPWTLSTSALQYKIHACNFSMSGPSELDINHHRKITSIQCGNCCMEIDRL